MEVWIWLWMTKLSTKSWIFHCHVWLPGELRIPKLCWEKWRQKTWLIWGFPKPWFPLNVPLTHWTCLNAGHCKRQVNMCLPNKIRNNQRFWIQPWVCDLMRQNVEKPSSCWYITINDWSIHSTAIWLNHVMLVKPNKKPMGCRQYATISGYFWYGMVHFGGNLGNMMSISPRCVGILGIHIRPQFFATQWWDLWICLTTLK